MSYNNLHGIDKAAFAIYHVYGLGGLGRTYEPEMALIRKLIKESHQRAKPKLVAVASTGGFSPTKTTKKRSCK